MSSNHDDLESTLSTEYLQNTILQRQKEMNELTEFRFRQLEDALKRKQAELEDERKNYAALKADFDYNLQLLKGRDDELQKYDSMFAQLKKTILQKSDIRFDWCN